MQRRYEFVINTDASFDRRTKTAGWACLIKSKDYTLKDAGVFSHQVPDSKVAEALAIGEALFLLDKFTYVEKHIRYLRSEKEIKLVFYTDSMWAVHALTGKMKKSVYLSVAKRLRAMTDEYEIEVNHVKAHTKQKTEAAIANKSCDYRSRRALQESRRN